jgi:hypothetical protein
MALPLEGIQAKIERTKKHITDLDLAIGAFLDTGPYKVGTKSDPNTRKLIYYISRVEDVPTEIIPQIAADAICNMVSILDHLAFRLFLKGGTGGDGRHIYFPISKNATNATEHETECKRKVKGMPQTIINGLFKIEAYEGGKGNNIWALNELNNLSKHRDVIAVGSGFRSLDIFAVMMNSPETKKQIEEFERRIGAKVPSKPVFLAPADRLCPLKVGDELFIDLPDSEVNEQMQFRFDVALNEPQIIHAEPLIETIHQLFKLVNDIVGQFATLL